MVVELSGADLEVSLVNVINVSHDAVVCLGPVFLVVVLVVSSDENGGRYGVGSGELYVLAVKEHLLAVDALLGDGGPCTSGDTTGTSVVVLVAEPKLRVGVSEGKEVVAEASIMTVVAELGFTEADLELLGVNVLDPGSKGVMDLTNVLDATPVVNGTNHERGGGERLGELLGLANNTLLDGSVDASSGELSTLPGGSRLASVVVHVELAVVRVESVPELLGFASANLEAGIGNSLDP